VSIVACRQALEVGLFSITPALTTAWENQDFVIQAGTPYQKVSFVPTTPDNPTFGGDHYQERGIFYIELNYPSKNGSVVAATRAELIRTTFKRGATFSSSGVSVTIQETPEVMQGFVEEGFWVLPIKIRFFANIN
jgi:hypothetical protein